MILHWRYILSLPVCSFGVTLLVFWVPHAKDQAVHISMKELGNLLHLRLEIECYELQYLRQGFFFDLLKLLNLLIVLNSAVMMKLLISLVLISYHNTLITLCIKYFYLP